MRANQSTDVIDLNLAFKLRNLFLNQRRDRLGILAASSRHCTERLPVVVPPPTPTKTGHSATVSSACVMAGCGVKG